MRWWLFYIVVLLLIVPQTGFCDETPQQKFNRAAYHISQEEFDEAFEIYSDIEESGYISGPLFLNMGITLVQVDSLGLAKYYFMKAGEFNETRRRAIEGLNYIDSEVDRRSGAIPVLFSSWWRDWLQFEIGIWNLLIGAIILFNIAAVILAAGWIRPGLSFISKIIGIPVIVIAVLAIIVSIWMDYRSEYYERGVIVKNEVTIKELPSDTSNEVSVAYEGFTVTHNRPKSEEHEGWSFVTLSNGVNGWVPSSGLRTL